jgi:hypothetical protein
MSRRAYARVYAVILYLHVIIHRAKSDYSLRRARAMIAAMQRYATFACSSRDSACLNRVEISAAQLSAP